MSKNNFDSQPMSTSRLPNLQFQSDISQTDAIAQLASRLTTELSAGKNVVWLVSGGSNIRYSVDAAKSVAPELGDKLTILLCDERYGPPGHADSNWQQLEAAGFMAVPVVARASMPSVLQAGLDLQATAHQYDQTVGSIFRNADVIIGQFGIGSDGHIAGILPGSEAAEPLRISTTEPTAFVIAYDGGNYQRITLTPSALLQVDAAYCFAYGQTKHAALDQLAHELLTLTDQPAQLLKQLPEAIVFRD